VDDRFKTWREFQEEQARMDLENAMLDRMIEQEERRERRERFWSEPTITDAEKLAWQMGERTGYFAFGWLLGHGIIIGASVLGLLVGFGLYIAGHYGYHMSQDTAVNLVVLACGGLGYMFCSIFGRIGKFIGKILFGIFLFGWLLQFFH